MIKKKFLKFILLIILFFYLIKFTIYFRKNKENVTNNDALKLHNLGSNVQIYGNDNSLSPDNPGMKITGKYKTYGDTHLIGSPYLQVEFTSNSESKKERIYLNPTNTYSPLPETSINLNKNNSYTIRVTNKNTNNIKANYGIMLQAFQVENPAANLN